MADPGKFRLWNDNGGKFITRAVVDGRFGTHKDCCCGCPCKDDIPNFTITIAGCPGNDCNNAAGDQTDYLWQGFIETDDHCAWQWQHFIGIGDLWNLKFGYIKATNAWCIIIENAGNPNEYFTNGDCSCGYSARACADITAEITCSKGDITSAPFTLAGQVDCAGCTATVTFT